MSDIDINNEAIGNAGAGGQSQAFFQVDDVQRMLGISRASAYKLVKQKGFPRIQVGNRIVIPCDLFNEWVANVATTGRC